MNNKSQEAIVCRSTRRYVDMYDNAQKMLRGTSADSVCPLCVGDRISFEIQEDNSCLVTDCRERTNILKRSSASKTKILAANIDHLLLITAPGTICKPQTIDRVLIAAAAENIPTTLVWNKNDLSKKFAESESIRLSYQAAGYKVLASSAVSSGGLDSIRSFLAQEHLSHVVFTGVSGVGKSSLINSLVDNAEARTQEVSQRSGYGRQTTSESFGYLYSQKNKDVMMLCDLPGVQQFGLAHLDEAAIRQGYAEFKPFSPDCRFSNCSHQQEPDCAVKSAINKDRISKLRYDSYSQILQDHRQSYY